MLTGDLGEPVALSVFLSDPGNRLRNVSRTSFLGSWSFDMGFPFLTALYNAVSAVGLCHVQLFICP